MPEIGIPLLDPLRIDNVTMVEGSGNFQLYFSMDNVTVKGLTNLELQSFRYFFLLAKILQKKKIVFVTGTEMQ